MSSEERKAASPAAPAVTTAEAVGRRVGIEVKDGVGFPV
jgi:hypothetical protein